MEEATIAVALRSLRDVAGVLGSFLLDREGRPLLADLPAMFDDAALNFSGERLVRLRAALETGGEPFAGCTSRFGEHLLVLRPVQLGTLCVLGSSDVSLATLDMGLSLVVRRITAEPAAPRESSPAPPPSGATTRFFRGRQL